MIKDKVYKLLDHLKLPRIPIELTKGNSYYAAYVPLYQKEKLVIQEGITGKDLVYLISHEVGHYFYDYYKEDVIDMDNFGKLFGNPSSLNYVSTFALVRVIEFSSGEELRLGDHPEYVSEYAQINAHEDWADTFAWVLKNRNKKHCGNRKLNQKVRMVRDCIEKSLHF